jgi:nicotinate-nucleotide adenylyltransferase
LALAGNSSFLVSRYETDRGGVNYTAATLAHFQEEDPGRELFFLLGADMLRDLPKWREPGRICQLALPVAVGRAGEPPVDFGPLAGLVSPERLDLIRQHKVEMPAIGLSGSEIRRRVAAGLNIRYRTPRAVEKYIEAKGLYRGDRDLGI